MRHAKEASDWCHTRRRLAAVATTERTCFVTYLVCEEMEQGRVAPGAGTKQGRVATGVGTKLVVAARAMVWRSGDCSWRRGQRRWCS